MICWIKLVTVASNRKIVKSFFTKVIICTIALICLQSFVFKSYPAFAHLGGGPPFLRVNGEFAQTNPYYLGVVTLNIPLDLSQQSYLINRPIIFSVDIPSLQEQTFMPPGFFTKVSFRWSYATGDNFNQSNGEYQYGNNVTYVFPHAGSYLITLEGKSPLDQGFVTIDNVQINVLPDSKYKLPVLSVFAGAADSVSNPALLVAKASFDKSVETAHYLWDFNEGKLESGRTIRHMFFSDVQKMGTGIIYTRTVDDYGFVTDIGFKADIVDNKIIFKPFDSANKVNTPLRYGTYKQAQAFAKLKNRPIVTGKTFQWYYVFLTIAALIIISVLTRFARTKHYD